MRGVPIEYAALILPLPATAAGGEGGGGDGGGGEWSEEDADADADADAEAAAEEAEAGTTEDDWAYGPASEAQVAEEAAVGKKAGGGKVAAPTTTPPPAAANATAIATEGDLWAWDAPHSPAPKEANATGDATAAAEAGAAKAAPALSPAARRAAAVESAALANLTAAAHGGDPGLWLDWPAWTAASATEEEAVAEQAAPPADVTAGAAAVVAATDPTGFTLLTMTLNEAQTAVTLRWMMGVGDAAKPVEEVMPLPGLDGGGATAPGGEGAAAGLGPEQSSAAAAAPKKSVRALARSRRVTAWGLVRVADFVVASVLAGAEEAEKGGRREEEGAAAPGPAPGPGSLAEGQQARPRKPKPSPRPPPPNVLYTPPTTPVKAYRDPGAAAARAFAAARVLLPGGPPLADGTAAAAVADPADAAPSHVPTVAGRRLTRSGRRLADSPGCDGFPDTTCTLACCARHDECYFRHGCTASSWAPTLKRAVGLEGGGGGGSSSGLLASPGAAALFLGALGGKIAAAAGGDAPAGPLDAATATPADVCVECNTNAVACLLAACGPLSGQGGGGGRGRGSSPPASSVGGSGGAGDRGDVCYDSDRGVGCSKFFTCPAAYADNGTSLVEDKTADDGSAGTGVDGLAAAVGSFLRGGGLVGSGLGADAALGVAPRPSSAAEKRRSGGRTDTCECPPTPADDHTGPCPTAENPCCAHAAIIGPGGCPGETGSVCPTPDAPYPCCCCPVGQACGTVAAAAGSKNGKGGVVHTCVDVA